jgi:ornithine carbamoyltransferase
MYKIRTKNLFSIKNIDFLNLNLLVNRTLYYSLNKPEEILKGKRVALVFSETSLRTKIAFELAAKILGAVTSYVEIPKVMKEVDGTPREDYVDVIKCLNRWFDAIVIRDYSKLYFESAKKFANLPIIDCFCGNDHPTQTIADLAIIKKYKEKATVCCICPNTGSAIMESFVYGAVIMGIKVRMLVPNREYKSKNKDFFQSIRILEKTYGGTLKITNNKKDATRKADFLYVDEWWENSPDFLKRNIGDYQCNKQLLDLSPQQIRVMHYLPAHHDREITKEVLHSKSSIAFEQAEFRLYSALASLEYIFNI